MTDQDDLRIEKCINELIEHFDSVQIFCSRDEPALEGGTIAMAKGSGNFMARYGQVKLWIVRMEESDRMMERSRDD